MGMDFSNIWELYGLMYNPFSTSPLLVRGGVLPIESFSGRKDEVERIIKQFRSGGGSRILVVGDVGIGKTTFVNVARYRAIQKGYFSPFKEIAVQEDWNAPTFIVNTLYAIYSTLKLRRGASLLSEKTYNKLRDLVELSTVEKKMRSVTVAGFGAGYNEEIKTAAMPSNMAIHEFLEEIVTEIYENTGGETILHYNNLERLSEKKMRKTFEDLRDFFQIPHIHFVFVGNLTVQGVFQSMPRLSSIISDTPILLKEMKFDEIEKIIDVRLNKLGIKTLRVVKPFQKSALVALYDVYGGNIRNILNSLSTATIEATQEKPVVLDKNRLAKILKKVVEKRYLDNLSPNARKILEESVKHEEITNRHLSRSTKIARSNVSTYLGNLQSVGCIYLRRKDGKDKYWSVDPKIKWLLLKYEEGEADQRTIAEY